LKILRLKGKYMLIKNQKTGKFRTVCLGIIIVAACNSSHHNKSIVNKDFLQIHLDTGSTGENGFLSVRHKENDQSLDADKLALITWWDGQEKVQSGEVSVKAGWEIVQESDKNGFTINCSHAGLGFSFRFELVINDSILIVNIPATDIKETEKNKLKSIRPLPYFGAANEGEEGYLIISREVGALCYYNNKEPQEYKLPVYNVNGIDMPLFGAVRGTAGFAGIVTSGQFDAQFCINTNRDENRRYSIGPEFDLRSFKDEELLNEDLTAEYHFMPTDKANWVDIGKCYRHYNFKHRDIVPLKQRIKESPELAYASLAMEVRLRLGVKPVPYEIVEQTLENEPAVRVFLTFEKVRDIFDEFKSQGIKEAEFCLVGWNKGGHDGRYPQILPVEPVLGGEDELRKTISYGKSLGYQVVAHDNYIDAYRIAESWDEGYLARNHEGGFLKGGQWGGGQAYHTCISQMYDLFAKKNLSIISDLGFKGLHYTDVLSITRPVKCYDPNHPASRRRSAEARNLIMNLADQLIGGVQSEGPLDFTAPILDRFIYTAIHTNQPSQLHLPYIDRNIPLYATVYHGVMTYNMDNRTFNTLPGETEYLENIEYGGVPMAYFYGHFYMEGSNRKNWIGNRDYRYDSEAGLKQAVVGLKRVYDDFQKLKHLQLEFIDGHNQLADGVFETLYSNGERVVVNYNDVTFQEPSGEKIPAKSFRLMGNCKNQ
jgi:hypothetical protein